MEAATHEGYWWRGLSIVEEPIAGTFVFDPHDGPVLKLFGSLKSPLEMFDLGGEPIIQGLSLTGKPITLVRCAESGSTLNVPGAMTSRYWAQFGLVGAHFNRPNDVKFPVVEVSFTNLHEWTLRHGFTVQGQHDPAGPFTLTYIRPATVTVTVNDLEIAIRCDFTPDQKSDTEWNLTQSTVIRVTAQEPKTLKDWLEGPLTYLMNFIAFGTGVPVYFTSVVGYVTHTEAHEGVRVLFQTRDPSTGHEVLPVTMLFGLHDLVEDLGQILNNWFKCHDEIGPVLELYFSTLYGAALHPHTRFLNLAQALESYHRRHYPQGGKLMEKTHFEALRQEFRKIVKAVLNNIPGTATAKAGIEERIRQKEPSLNDMPLSDRLNRLIQEASPTVVAAAIPNPAAFEKVVRYTRNWLTHYDESSRKHAATGIELLNVTERMQWLLNALLLKRLGLSDAKTEQLLRRNERLKHAAQWTSALPPA